MADKALNINDIRDILADEIQKIRSGETTAANVNAITNATGKILSTVKMEMEYCRLTGKNPDIDLFIAPSKQTTDTQKEKSKLALTHAGGTSKP